MQRNPGSVRARPKDFSGPVGDCPINCTSRMGMWECCYFGSGALGGGIIASRCGRV
jgi:hypothetical protein